MKNEERYEVFPRHMSDGSKQWFWRRVAKNNRKTAVSGESYHNRTDCWRAADNNRGMNKDIPIVELEK